MDLKVNISAWDAILNAGIIVQLTLGLLVFLSIWSWAVILGKRMQFRRVISANTPFLDSFWKASSLDAIFEKVQNETSPLARVFKTGYLELQRLAGTASTEKSKTPLLSGIDNLQRALNKAIDAEVSALEERLNILATVGSTGPFIGLFGTVWGIMGSFQNIGATGSANLAIVAPGISEALVATAVGLAAAIPAVVFYNHFLTKLKREELTLNTFAADFLNIAKRNFFKDH